MFRNKSANANKSIDLLGQVRYNIKRGEFFLKNDNSNIKTLFLTFLKIGVFTFGGGYAMIALLETEFCVRKNWLDKKEFLDMTAISESTPGPTAVNSATYIGYKIGGVLGAIAATVGVCIPSFFIIYIISLFFDKFLSLKVVYAAFRGIQVGVIYLILTAGLRMLKALDNTLLDKIIMLGVFIMMILFTLFFCEVFISILYYHKWCCGHCCVSD